jgi:hypothetical protein
MLPLRDASGVVLLRADHYRQIRTDEPWRVPVLLGALPTTPHSESTAEEKGKYALFIMMLFRPWRSVYGALTDWMGSPGLLRRRAQADVWLALYDAYTTWSQWLTSATTCYCTPPGKPTPAFNTADWWACMSARCVDNLSIVLSRRMEHTKPPTTIDGLPVDEDVVDDIRSESSVESDADAVKVADDDGAADASGSDSDVNREDDAYPAVVGMRCGRLPIGVDVQEFLSLPANVTGKSAEANYAKEYTRRVVAAQLDASSLTGPTKAVPTEASLFSISCGSAADKAAQQTELFGKLDAFLFDETKLYPSHADTQQSMQRADDWSAQLGAETADLRAQVNQWPKHHTVVLEAAAHLLRSGILNVKGTRKINVKQGRALLHFACWLQRFKSTEWTREGILEKPV